MVLDVGPPRVPAGGRLQRFGGLFRSCAYQGFTLGAPRVTNRLNGEEVHKGVDGQK